jgi:serine/threonine protein kinase
MASSKDLEGVTMTAVGTPLFAAPEIARGESYDESVDVYSFGLMLVNLATIEPILDFIAERWRVDHGKQQAPKQAMRFIRCWHLFF